MVAIVKTALLLNFFKKRYKVKNIPQKDRHKPSLILNTPKKKEYKRNHIGSRSNIKFKKILFGLLGIGLILGIVFLVNSFFSIKEYRLDLGKVTILGNKTISNADIESIISEYQGRHIALIDAREIENKLLKDFQIIRGVQITKLYPNGLFIKINEREAKLVCIALNAAYVLDTSGKILDIIGLQKIDFPQEKILISRGLGDMSSQILKDYFLNQFILDSKLAEKTPAEREQLIAAGYSFDVFTPQQKIVVLKTLAVEYKSEIDNLFAKNSGAILGSEYRDLPEVYLLQNEELSPNDSIDLERQNLSLELINRLGVSKIEYNQLRWEGSILVKVILKDNKQLIFGTNRPLSDQWEDYLLVQNDLVRRGKGYSVIDVSSTKISVIN